MKKLIALSTKIYDTSRVIEYRRMAVFIIRSMANQKYMQNLMRFFDETPLKQKISAHVPFLLEQATRKFFYKNSKCMERCTIIQEHFNFLVKHLKDSCIENLYLDSEIFLWQEEYKGQTLALVMKFEPGQKKEGLLSVILKLGDHHLYQIIFLIADDKKSGKPALWIGAMQGSNTKNASEIIKGLTKRFFGYRTKNLILYATRAVARALDIKTIYAVSNDGYYANNHLRLDRKLKTSLDGFWQETGGTLCTDKRFYELPVVEHRKSIEEVKTHKRNQYRKRFEALDAIDAAIEEIVATRMKK